MLTLSQALSHLHGIRNLCVAENVMLPCVRDAVRTAQIDIMGLLRYDHIKSYKDVQALKEAIRQTEKSVDNFLGGDV